MRNIHANRNAVDLSLAALGDGSARRGSRSFGALVATRGIDPSWLPWIPRDREESWRMSSFDKAAGADE